MVVLCFNTVLLLNLQGLDGTHNGRWSLTGKMERFLGQLFWGKSLGFKKEIGTKSMDLGRCEIGFSFSWSGHHRV